MKIVKKDISHYRPDIGYFVRKNTKDVVNISPDWILIELTKAKDVTCNDCHHIKPKALCDKTKCQRLYDVEAGFTACIKALGEL
jgi:hypothetical protein